MLSSLLNRKKNKSEEDDIEIAKRVLLNFGEIFFDPFQVKGIELKEGYNKLYELGISYLIIIHFYNSQDVILEHEDVDQRKTQLNILKNKLSPYINFI